MNRRSLAVVTAVAGLAAVAVAAAAAPDWATMTYEARPEPDQSSWGWRFVVHAAIAGVAVLAAVRRSTVLAALGAMALGLAVAWALAEPWIIEDWQSEWDVTSTSGRNLWLVAATFTTTTLALTLTNGRDPARSGRSATTVGAIRAE